MNPQQQACAVGDGLAEIADVGAVSRADLAQNDSGMPHDLRNPKPVADFDQFAARNNHFVSGGELVQRQVDGGGVVVDHNRGMTKKPFEQFAGMGITLSPLARYKV